VQAPTHSYVIWSESGLDYNSYHVICASYYWCSVVPSVTS